ncbi:DNA repair protein RecN [Thalassotalea euphylliae]|uniref:DNA repair protein RecN n=1 Tax=Thalassotalea euphylliae TaxID=1655234 RepID=A0A3E0TYL2_9GAMM|nr:DNA repair protein RecN [Thalassotalea euphylliae]REL28962.1 DNA repair protein RecN [Thalassotalea euphylliae]
MLLQLTIQNFAIVKALDIDWQQGMTTITGETGAGKSIAIDALGLCLGERATTNTVRPGAKKADLAATFDVTNNALAQQWLASQELQLAQSDSDLNDNSIEAQECILRRVISAEGRSRAFINGSQVPLAQLKELGQLLINIHGQHDHQLIIKPNEQRKMLDAFAGHDDLIDNVEHYYQSYRKQVAELEALELSQQQREAKKQLLQYQVQELDEFSLQADEFQTLEADFKRFSHSQQILSDTMESLHILSQNEQFNALDALQKCHDTLSTLAHYDSELANIATIINDAVVQLEEANNDLRHYHDRLELDPQAFSIIEERYSQAIQLAKKHQVVPEQLPDYHQQLTLELNSLNGDETRLAGLADEIEQTKQHYFEAAQILTNSRMAAGKTLSSEVTTSIQTLNMPHGQFDVAITPLSSDRPSAQGQDEVLFVVSINPGQSLEAMHKVASGGELSRISLAMQVILADKVVSPTLIFDEVDVGISGPTAAMVGAKLQQLANNTQVICVTHLPQVACKGHQQLFVAKLTDGEHTETSVTELSEGARVKEIARLLAGNTITESSLANAQELLAG